MAGTLTKNDAFHHRVQYKHSTMSLCTIIKTSVLFTSICCWHVLSYTCFSSLLPFFLFQVLSSYRTFFTPHFKNQNPVPQATNKFTLTCRQQKNQEQYFLLVMPQTTQSSKGAVPPLRNRTDSTEESGDPAFNSVFCFSEGRHNSAMLDFIHYK